MRAHKLGWGILALVVATHKQVHSKDITMRVFIHTGHASFDNGAKFPISFFFELAKALQTDAVTGEYYGRDYLEISDEDWPVAEELLVENKMLYRIHGKHQEWQNIVTDHVREKFARH